MRLPGPPKSLNQTTEAINQDDLTVLQFGNICVKNLIPVRLQQLRD